MSAPEFVEGVLYKRDVVVRKCESRIDSDRKIKNPEEKRRYVDLIRNCPHEEIVFSPFGSGWGRSPLNPKCWLTKDGKPICDGPLNVSGKLREYRGY